MGMKLLLSLPLSAPFLLLVPSEMVCPHPDGPLNLYLVAVAGQVSIIWALSGQGSEGHKGRPTAQLLVTKPLFVMISSVLTYNSGTEGKW